MMQSSGDAGEVAQTNSNVTRLFFEDRSPFVLRHRPPGIGILIGIRAARVAEGRLGPSCLEANCSTSLRVVYHVLLVDPRRIHAAVEPFTLR
jgi:hypothetical protein